MSEDTKINNTSAGPDDISPPLSYEERKKLREERRQRRRRRLDIRLSRRGSLWMYCTIAVIALFLLVFPRSKTSNIEKRDLAKFPKLTLEALASGEFTRGVMTFYDDTVPFRDGFKNIDNRMASLSGINTQEDVVIVGNVAVVENTEKKTESAADSADAAAENKGAEAESAEAPEEEVPEAPKEASFDNGFLIVYENDHWRGLPLFGGGQSLGASGFLNMLRSYLPAEIKMYAMPIPLASEYYLPEEYSDYSADQNEAIQYFFSSLDEGITPVDLVPVLGEHASEEIYLRTDHHWSQLGAYYAGKAFTDAAGVPYADISEYHRVERPGYVGSLYGATQNANLLADPEVFTYYVPSAPYVSFYHLTDYTFRNEDDLFVPTDCANSYVMFTEGDDKIVHIVTGVNNGRKLVVLKDSYGNPLAPLLTSSFEEIFICDYRFCDVNLSNFIWNMGITDFLYCCDTYTVADDGLSYYYLLEQNSGIPIPFDEPDTVPGTSPGSYYYEETADGSDPLLIGENVSYAD